MNLLPAFLTASRAASARLLAAIALAAAFCVAVPKAPAQDSILIYGNSIIDGPTEGIHKDLVAQTVAPRAWESLSSTVPLTLLGGVGVLDTLPLAPRDATEAPVELAPDVEAEFTFALAQDEGPEPSEPCSRTGNFTVEFYPGDISFMLSTSTVLLHCDDGTTRRRTEITRTAFQEFTKIVTREMARPDGTLCSPEVETTFEMRWRGQWSRYRYPDGFCPEDDGDCCILTEEKFDLVKTASNVPGTPFSSTRSIACPGQSEPTGTETTTCTEIVNKFKTVTTKKFEPLGSCDPYEECPPEVSEQSASPEVVSVDCVVSDDCDE